MANPAIQDKRRYVKLSLPGSGSFICEPKVADEIQREEPDAGYVREDRWMTPAEFEALSDFAGF